MTLLFTDVEGSTRPWEADAGEMRNALAAHDEVLQEAIEAHGGFVFKRLMTTAAMATYAYDEIAQARTELESDRSRPWPSLS